MVKEMIKKDLKDKWFWIYTILLIICTALFLFVPINAITILSLFGLAISQLIYNFNSKVYKEHKNQKIFGWIYFIIFLIFAIIHTSTITKEVEVGVITILLTIATIFIISIIGNYVGLRKTENKTRWIILFYIGLSISVISFFGFLYVISSGFNQGVSLNGTLIEGVWDYMFFSLSIFYTSPFGIPIGFSKFLVSLELIVSFITHIIILGKVINN